MYGRRVVYTDEVNITAGNLLKVLRECLKTHEENRRDIEKLWDIYRGKTDILGKTKEIREEINHKVCENHAWETVNFYDGYEFGEPIQYIHRGECKSDSEILKLNELMDALGKDTKDGELATWMHVCGVGYRLVLKDGIYTLDPRYTFVARNTGAERRKVMSVSMVRRQDGGREFTCYTDTKQFELSVDEQRVKIFDDDSLPITLPMDGVTIREKDIYTGNPIVEYTANPARFGCFEAGVPLLNAINELQSNRMDDVEATVNAILVLLGASMEEGQYSQLQEEKMLSLPNGTDAKYLTCQLDQNGTQKLLDDLYQKYLEIVGMPNRNGSGGTSDNGIAVIYRDGWQDAEANAKTMEKMFRQPEREMLGVLLRVNPQIKLDPKDIVIKFTRRNYDNLLTKVEALTMMLENPNIHPETAFVSCGLFVDPVGEYLKGQEWKDAQSVEEPLSE